MIVRGETDPVLGRLLVGSRATASAEPKELLACFTPDTLGHIKIFRSTVFPGNGHHTHSFIVSQALMLRTTKLLLE